MIITRIVSALVPDGDGEMIYERFLRASVPEEMVDECVKTFS